MKTAEDRPACVYPECEDTVATWCTTMYVPLDTLLCKFHQDAYDRTVRSSPGGGVVSSWAQWHATEVLS